MCGTEYRSFNEAYKCEAKCLGLTVDQYKEYIKLLQEEKKAFRLAEDTLNDDTRKRYDDAIKAVIAFKNIYNIMDTR